MTTTIVVIPNEHPLLINQNQTGEHRGLYFHNFREELLMPGDPKRQYHISEGGTLSVTELKADDPRAVSERDNRDPPSIKPAQPPHD